VTLRDILSENMKVRLRHLLGKLGVEVGSFTGSFADHRAQLLSRAGVLTVWDVGAHVGQFGSRLRTTGYGGRLISIEPGLNAFRQLSRRASGDADWTPLSIAISDYTGEATLHVSANGQSSSLLPINTRHVMANAGSRYVDSEIVQVTTLDALRPRVASVAPFYVKLDLQGGELPALRGASEVLRDTVACEVELSFADLYDGGAAWKDVLAHLGTEGFIICDIERVFFDPASKDLLQINALLRTG
jgi:FkbM family methyltransferase